MNMKSVTSHRKFLGDNPLFGEVDEKDVADLMSFTIKKRFTANAKVVVQGEVGHEMYFIDEGSVFIRLCIAENEELTIGELYAGEVFGEIALFDQLPRTATVVTAEPSNMLVLTREKFNNFLLDRPRVAIHLLTVMSRRLRSANDFLRDAMYTDVTSRLAETLKKISRAYGKNTAKGLRVDIEFADNELGEYAGLPADVVTAQLRHWQKDGIIEINHGCLTIIKPEELTKESH